MQKSIAAHVPYHADSERKKNILGQKIARARKLSGLTLAELAEQLNQCGVNASRSSVSKWENGNSLPDPYQLFALAYILDIAAEGIPFFTSDWTPELNEVGEKKVREYRMDLIASGRYLPEQAKHSVIRLFPFCDLPASAGRGNILFDDYFQDAEFPEDVIPEKADFALRIAGDSMMPVYRPNDVVWVESTASLYPGEIGIFMYDGESFIKEYHCERTVSECSTHPVLYSLNPAYAPISVASDRSFRIVGRVLGICPADCRP